MEPTTECKHPARLKKGNEPGICMECGHIEERKRPSEIIQERAKEIHKTRQPLPPCLPLQGPAQYEQAILEYLDQLAGFPPQK